MGGEWRYGRMDEVVDFLPKRTIKKGSVEPFIAMADIPENSREPSNISQKEFKGGGSKFCNGDTVFARITPCLQNGKTAKISGLIDGQVAHGSTEFIILGAKESTDQDYIYYLSRLPEFRAYAESRMEGSTGRQRVSWQALSEYELNFPTKKERRKIGEFLSVLDNKIELNRQTNETLEKMAQALFKSWFVDFDPVIDNALAAGNTIPDELQDRAERRQQQLAKPDHQPLPDAIRQLFPNEFELTEELGWVPMGWEVCSLGEKVTVKRGGSPRPIKNFIASDGLPWTKISDASASKTRFIRKTREFIKPEGLSKTTFLKKGTLILSNSATPGLPKFLDLDACIHDGWLHFPKVDTFNDHYLYQLFLVIRQELIQQGNGTVFTNLKTDILRDHIVVVASKAVMNNYGCFVGDIHKKLIALADSTDTLEKLRDTLLPKLISGELRLPPDASADAEQQLADATS